MGAARGTEVSPQTRKSSNSVRPHSTRTPCRPADRPATSSSLTCPPSSGLPFLSHCCIVADGPRVGHALEKSLSDPDPRGLQR